MRILKYFFLIILLLAFGAAVFTATQKGEYDVSRSTVVPLPRSVVYQYVNELRNWQLWHNEAADATFSAVTSGKGSRLQWDSSMSDGSITNIGIRDNDSISQLIQDDGSATKSFWTFKDTVGGTKVTWRVMGKMGFMPKVHSTLQGGPKKIIGDDFDNRLNKLKNSIVSEITKYNIKVDGLVHKPGTGYLKQTITSKIVNLPKNISIMESKLIHFFKKNKMMMAGKPFVLYDYYDLKKGLTQFSVCIPVREEIFTAPGSDVTYGSFPTFLAVKTTLYGDHSHLREAWDKTFAYIQENKHQENTDAGYIEVYTIGKEDEARPSQRITEIFVPIAQEEIPPVPVVPRPKPVPPSPADDSGSGEISIP